MIFKYSKRFRFAPSFNNCQYPLINYLSLLQDEKENVTRKLRLTKNKEHGIISVNGAEIIHSLVDQTAKNGIVHFIDEVIYPIPTGTIYDYIKEDDRFRTLFQAIGEFMFFKKPFGFTSFQI